MGDTMSRCCGTHSVTDTDMKRPNMRPAPVGQDASRGDMSSHSKDAAKPNGLWYTVRLDRTGGRALGIKTDHLDGDMLLVSTIGPDGLVQAWNKANPSSCVREGHRILQVNGKSGDVTALIEECKKLQVLEITLAPAV
mmetsp:Transcript_16256/g.44771  ORF Transcript_16256/g.44771 Transcript_16256/m.44771 type:complete len:138 (-) Transcript_16256:108-521(-)